MFVACLPEPSAGRLEEMPCLPVRTSEWPCVYIHSGQRQKHSPVSLVSFSVWIGVGVGGWGWGWCAGIARYHPSCATAGERFRAARAQPARHGPHCASFGTHGGAESTGATAATRPARLQFGACHTELWLQPSPDYGSKRAANCAGAALRKRSTDDERAAGAAG